MDTSSRLDPSEDKGGGSGSTTTGTGVGGGEMVGWGNAGGKFEGARDRRTAGRPGGILVAEG